MNGTSGEINVRRLTDTEDAGFPCVCDWFYTWFGKRDGRTPEMIAEIVGRSLNVGTQLPQTFVAYAGEMPVGVYQLLMSDDLASRPDVYPWLGNVYVDESRRKRGVCRAMLETVRENAARAGVDELYLYTALAGLYERFGWRFVGPVNTFRAESPVERLYKLSIGR